MYNVIRIGHTSYEVITMVLTAFDQLNLLNELLEKHKTSNSGSIAEYQEIKSLVQSISTKNKFNDEQLLQLLPEIYNYGLQGELAQSLQEHVSTNKQNIISWTNAIGEIQLE